MSTRREFISGLTAIGGAAVFSGCALLPQDKGVRAALAAPGDDKPPAEYLLPPLQYDYAALEPHIDAETMHIHHDKHHAAYTAGLNAALKALAAARDSGDFANIQQLSRLLSFHAGGYFNHIVFWNNMAAAGKGGGGDPTGKLASDIARDFGSIEKFKAQFSAAAGGVEGNGWGLLGFHPTLRRLVIMTPMNQQDLCTIGTVPLLMCDVWEHAYYLKYKNARPDYIKAWWNVVNWKDVAERYDVALRA